MKKIFLFLLINIPPALQAQNLQLHYDFGEERKYFTATLEMFKPDSLGSTFWFVDLDFNFPGTPNSMSAAYWEISREFYIPWLKRTHLSHLGFHLEYNDGFTAYTDSGESMGAASYNSVFLTGFSHPLKAGPLELSAQALLRLPKGMDKPDFQFTVVWFHPLLKNRLLFTGFLDIWSQDRVSDTEGKELVFQAEPQLWIMLIPNIAVGSELEISRNFPVGPNEWEFLPTLGFRWEF